MNLGCLLVIFLQVTTSVDCGWMSDMWRKVAGDPCPDKSEVRKRIAGFRFRLGQNLIGQGLVEEKLVSMMENHLSLESQKPLVISMHGWTGSGKNYATQILVESFYEYGLTNDHVHFFSGRLNFPLSTGEAVDEYKVNLHNWIRGNVSRCGLSMFIFDEIDKVPTEVVEAIKPFLDYHSTLNRVDYRSAIFVFISNIGGNIILRKYMELWESGISRSKMEYKSFEPVLRKYLYNSEGMFKKSSILENHLVSLYLPFLPMEKEHVSLCISREMMRQGIRVTDKGIDYVLNSMEFFIDRFSLSGCKRVSDQVAMLKFMEKDEL